MNIKQIIIMIILTMLLASITRLSKKQEIVDNNIENQENKEEFQKIDDDGVIYLPEEEINPNN